jgi:alkylhydroperoxidase family enzyme
VTRARNAEAADAHVAAILDLARAIVRTRGRIDASAIATARAAGVTDAELTEIVAHVALNIFTNYLNLVADTEIDFPVVHAAELAAV